MYSLRDIECVSDTTQLVDGTERIHRVRWHFSADLCSDYPDVFDGNNNDAGRFLIEKGFLTSEEADTESSCFYADFDQEIRAGIFLHKLTTYLCQSSTALPSLIQGVVVEINECLSEQHKIRCRLEQCRDWLSRIELRSQLILDSAGIGDD